MTGVLTYSSDTISNHSTVVRATATGTMLSATVAVTITFVAMGTAPRFTELLYDAFVTEDAAVGVVLMSLQAEGGELDFIYQLQNDSQVSASICRSA